jgi:glycosyltransferase involved in cell wall biosynthesis
VTKGEPSGRRIRVLFVSPSLAQAGAERYVFEYARALDPRRFEVEVLTSESVTPDDFYYPKLLAHGIKVHRDIPKGRDHIIDMIPDKRRLRPIKQALRKLDQAAASLEQRRLGAFFRGYDIISLAQIEAYYLVAGALSPSARAVIHLMSHRFQYDRDPYARCRPGVRYRCLLFDPAQAEELRGSAAEGAETAVLPLALDLAGRENLYAPRPGGPKKIAIVSRIDPTRRLEPMFYAFQAMARRADIRLHLYGRGDPDAFRYLFNVLHIRDKVIFAGHKEDLEAALRSDQPDLVWMMSVGAVMGYGGIEIGSFGVPIAFYNYSKEPDHDVLEKTAGAVHSASTVPDFVDLSEALLADPKALRELGERLRGHVVATHDIQANIHRLEAYYAGLMGAPLESL